MKRCPKCSKQYPAEFSFCPQDETALIFAEPDNAPPTASIPSLVSSVGTRLKILFFICPLVNGENKDLAYIYYKDGNRWRNVAIAVGVTVDDFDISKEVPEFIPDTALKTGDQKKEVRLCKDDENKSNSQGEN